MYRQVFDIFMPNLLMQAQQIKVDTKSLVKEKREKTNLV
jgi:hypothetical protein